MVLPEIEGLDIQKVLGRAVLLVARAEKCMDDVARIRELLERVLAPQGDVRNHDSGLYRDRS